MSIKVGDIVTDDFYEDCGIVISGPRVSRDCEHVRFGTMDGDVYYVVDVLCIDGTRRLFTTDEIRKIDEGR
tara:strand:+ start:2886 stop:3098 length:213 start_codon:yes stop_codon:yes gene_type:complete